MISVRTSCMIAWLYHHTARSPCPSSVDVHLEERLWQPLSVLEELRAAIRGPAGMAVPLFDEYGVAVKRLDEANIDALQLSQVVAFVLHSVQQQA